MAFAIPTPLREPGPSVSEAGGSGASALSDMLTEAQAQIADLSLQLGAARAELKVRTELRKKAETTAPEAKHEGTRRDRRATCGAPVAA